MTEAKLVPVVPVNAAHAAYGALWCMTTDNSSIKAARMHLLAAIGGQRSEGQRAAIQWAASNVVPPPDHEIAAIDVSPVAAPEPVSDPGEDYDTVSLREAAIAVIEWCDLVAKYPDDFRSSRPDANLHGPVFDGLRAAISAQPLSNTQELEQGAAARVDAVAKGGKVEDVYGGESWPDPAVAFRNDLKAVLAAPVVGDPVKWEARIKGIRSGFLSKWAECDGPSSHEGIFGEDVVEYRALYAHPDPKIDVVVKALNDILDCNVDCQQAVIAVEALAQIKGGA